MAITLEKIKEMNIQLGGRIEVTMGGMKYMRYFAGFDYGFERKCLGIMYYDTYQEGKRQDTPVKRRFESIDDIKILEYKK